MKRVKLERGEEIEGESSVVFKCIGFSGRRRRLCQSVASKWDENAVTFTRRVPIPGKRRA